MVKHGKGICPICGRCHFIVLRKSEGPYSVNNKEQPPKKVFTMIEHSYKGFACNGGGLERRTDGNGIQTEQGEGLQPQIERRN